MRIIFHAGAQVPHLPAGVTYQVRRGTGYVRRPPRTPSRWEQLGREWSRIFALTAQSWKWPRFADEWRDPWTDWKAEGDPSGYISYLRTNLRGWSAALDNRWGTRLPPGLRTSNLEGLAWLRKGVISPRQVYRVTYRGRPPAQSLETAPIAALYSPADFPSWNDGRLRYWQSARMQPMVSVGPPRLALWQADVVVDVPFFRDQHLVMQVGWGRYRRTPESRETTAWHIALRYNAHRNDDDSVTLTLLGRSPIPWPE